MSAVTLRNGPVVFLTGQGSATLDLACMSAAHSAEWGAVAFTLCNAEIYSIPPVSAAGRDCAGQHSRCLLVRKSHNITEKTRIIIYSYLGGIGIYNYSLIAVFRLI